jgi:hypothetical protein
MRKAPDDTNAHKATQTMRATRVAAAWRTRVTPLAGLERRF